MSVDTSFHAQIVVCSLTAIVCGLLPPAFGFGCAITFCCFWYLSDDLNLLDVDSSAEALVATVTLLNIVVHGVTSVQFRHEVNLKYSLVMFTIMAPGAIAGCILVDTYGESTWGMRILGMLMLLTTITILLRRRNLPMGSTFDFNTIFENNNTILPLVVACIVSGGLSGCSGIGDAPFMVLAIFLNLQRETFIGTFMVARLVISFIVYGVSLFKNDALNEGLVMSLVGTACGGLLGTILGKELFKMINHEIYMKCLQVILLGSCLAVIFNDGSNKEVYIVGITVMLISSYYLCRRWFKRNKKMEHEVLRENSIVQTSGGTFGQGPLEGESQDSDVHWGESHETCV